MGPRPIGRGNGSGRKVRPPTCRSLQWGRDRSVAEIRGVLRMASRARRLQWGRDRSVAEMRTRLGYRSCSPCSFNGAATDRSRKFIDAPPYIGNSRLCFNGAATDRSRKFDRDRETAIALAGFNGAATDRSRKSLLLHAGVRRGHGGFNGAATDRSRKCAGSCGGLLLGVPGLQWGRDRSVAEMSDPAGETVPPRGLQWGRDRSVAEMPMAVFASSGTQGLQWGRDRSVAEIVRLEMTPAPARPASMGPRPIGRGNSSGFGSHPITRR